MAKYDSKIHTVDALEFSFDTLKDIYLFLGFKDVTYNVKDRTISGVITDQDGLKLHVNKGDYVVKDENNKISVWKNKEFNQEFILKE